MDRTQLTPLVLKAPPIIEEAVEDLMTGVDTPPDQTEAIEGANESRDEADSRSWRGVFAIAYPDEALFTKRIDIRPDQLEEWKPRPITGH